MQGRFLVRFVGLGIVLVAVLAFLQQSGVFGNGSYPEGGYEPRLPAGEPQVYRLPTIPEPGQPAFAVVESDPEAQGSEADHDTE